MINKTAIVGMGALGMLYANQIIETQGKDAVEFVMDAPRVEKYREQVFTTNESPMEYNMTAAEDAHPADLIIVAVKYPALRDALECMKNSVGENTIILSVMNGVTSEKIIAEHFGAEKVLSTVAQGMDAMKFGNKLTYTQKGELILGRYMQTPSQDEKLREVTRYFDEVGIPYQVDENIQRRMWGKFMLNVGVNQVCMVYEMGYAQVLAPGDANRMMIAAMREVRAVAEAEGVLVTEKDLTYFVNLLKTLAPEGVPSMAQDRINKKPSEVDMFAGAVIKMARRHDIYVPANQYLHDRVKEIERAYI